MNKNSMIPISEIFYSLQGEWRNTGKPSIFVRFWGCNLRCGYCDTPYAVIDNTQLQELELEKIVEQIKSYPCKHIVFSWGEPSMYEKLIANIMWQLEPHYTTEIETNWKLPLTLKYNQVNVSYKTTNSWNPPYELKALTEFHDYDYKFVVKDEKDLQEVEEIIKKYDLPKENIYLMPLGIDKESQNNLVIAQYCLGKGYKYCQRTHIVLFGNRRWV